MFNVGGGELFAILLLGLLILGPERLPKAMGEIGKYVAQLRRLSSGFQDEIRRAMDPDDAPFRPGEERLGAGNVDDEVRVIGADVDEEVRVVGADLDDEDGVIDTSATEHDPRHAALDDDEPVPSDPPSRPADGDQPDEGWVAEDRAGADETSDRPVRDVHPSDSPTRVTSLHGRDEGGTRAAG